MAQVKSTKTYGAPGTAIYGGYIQSDERDSRLGTTRERQRNYSEILANVSIVASGVRYFLNLVARADWSFTPSEDDSNGQYAEILEEILTEDPWTPWHRIVRRAAAYRFYGFSLQEWTAKRRSDGIMTFKDVAPRSQLTIERWDVDPEGQVRNAIQRSPQTSLDLVIPRSKLLYLVDDTLSDSPEGLGLFRHLMSPAERLRRYEKLEGFGYETDLRGIPIGRVPFSEMDAAVQQGRLTEAQRIRIEEPMRTFIQNHIKTPDMGMLLDSITYESKDESGRASNIRQWDIELLKGGSQNFGDIAKAIERVNMEMARILGVEQLMLGTNQGSFALSRDKTDSFFLLVDGALREIQEAVRKDLVDTIWRLNGWDNKYKPELAPEITRHSDVQEIAAVLKDMATAGALLDPEDPVIGEVRELLGLSKPDHISMATDAALTPTAQNTSDEINQEGE
jgi:hypothetical protein